MQLPADLRLEPRPVGLLAQRSTVLLCLAVVWRAIFYLGRIHRKLKFAGGWRCRVLTSFSAPHGWMAWWSWLGTVEDEESICHSMWKWIVAPAWVCQWSWLALAWVSGHRLAGENHSGSSREPVFSHLQLPPSTEVSSHNCQLKSPNLPQLSDLMGAQSSSGYSWPKEEGMIGTHLIQLWQVRLVEEQMVFSKGTACLKGSMWVSGYRVQIGIYTMLWKKQGLCHIWTMWPWASHLPFLQFPMCMCDS